MTKSSTGAEIPDIPMDEFQARYVAHQTHPGGKRDELIKLVQERHSNRRFSDKEVSRDTLNAILESLRHCPNSCDRFGTRVKIVTDRDDKALLNGLLVGAVGWLYRAPTVLMLWANTEAYKGGENGDEVNYNSYLDAGIMAQTAMLVATSLGLHTAIVNPQVRSDNKDIFYNRFKPKEWDNALFCCAVAVGYPHPEAIKKTRRLIDSVVIE